MATPDQIQTQLALIDHDEKLTETFSSNISFVCLSFTRLASTIANNKDFNLDYLLEGLFVFGCGREHIFSNKPVKSSALFEEDSPMSELMYYLRQEGWENAIDTAYEVLERLRTLEMNGRLFFMKDACPSRSAWEEVRSALVIGSLIVNKKMTFLTFSKVKGNIDNLYTALADQGIKLLR